MYACFQRSNLHRRPVFIFCAYYSLGLSPVWLFMLSDPRLFLVDLAGCWPRESRVEFAPLIATLNDEGKPWSWRGVFAHVDLVAILPDQAGDDEHPQIRCSAGVAFVIIPLLGQARYITTSFPLLVSSMVIVSAAVLLLAWMRVRTWSHPVEEPPSPGMLPQQAVSEIELIDVPPPVTTVGQDPPAGEAASVGAGLPLSPVGDVGQDRSLVRSTTVPSPGGAQSNRFPRTFASTLRQRSVL